MCARRPLSLSGEGQRGRRASASASEGKNPAMTLGQARRQTPDEPPTNPPPQPVPIASPALADRRADVFVAPYERDRYLNIKCIMRQEVTLIECLSS